MALGLDGILQPVHAHKMTQPRNEEGKFEKSLFFI